jgi:hypothetical protein
MTEEYVVPEGNPALENPYEEEPDDDWGDSTYEDSKNKLSSANKLDYKAAWELWAGQTVEDSIDEIFGYLEEKQIEGRTQLYDDAFEIIGEQEKFDEEYAQVQFKAEIEDYSHSIVVFSADTVYHEKKLPRHIRTLSRPKRHTGKKYKGNPKRNASKRNISEIKLGARRRYAADLRSEVRESGIPLQSMRPRRLTLR